MTSPRAITRAAVTSGIAALAVLGFSPALSFAAASDSVTVAGGSTYTYTFNQSPSIQAVAQPDCQILGSASTVTLSIDGPGVTNSTLLSHAGSCSKAVTLSPSASSVNTSHPAWDGGTLPADNGSYTVTLTNQGRAKSASFILLIPPAKPTGFTAEPAGGTYATFSWQPNPEADITSYEIMDSSGNVLASPDNPCAAGTCLAGPVDVGDSAAGKTERYSLVAIRSCGDAACNGGQIAGPSTTADATFPAAPSPSPTPTPTKSGGGKGGSGGGGSGGGSSGKGGGSGSNSSGSGSSGSGSGAITLHGDGSSVNLGKTNGSGSVNNTLPPALSGSLPSVQAPPLPGVKTSTETLGAGVKPGNIKYPAPLLAHKASSQGIVHDLKSGLSLPPLWRGIAAAAVLILIAVHLRAWVSRTDGAFDEPGSRPVRTY